MARDAATRYGLDPSIFVNQIAVESSYDVNARDYATGTHYGLGQIGQAAVQDVGGDITQVFDPYSNLDYSAKYLKMLHDKFGNYYDALRAYTAGPTGAANNRRAGADYANKVIARAMGNVPDPMQSGIVDPLGRYHNPTAINPATPGAAVTAASGFLSTRAWELIQTYGMYALIVTIIVLAIVFGVYAIITGENAPSPKGGLKLAKMVLR